MSGEPGPLATIPDIVWRRGIGEVLHFTSLNGLIGILATGRVACRDRLSADQYIEHVYLPNCENRLKDADWTGYVNLSITTVNKRMLDSSNSWHANDGVWWTVLAFEPSILSDEGVWFATTNNTYTAVVKRATGASGLDALYANRVAWGWYGSIISRGANTAINQPTDPQAEVLYPDVLQLDHLSRIYVSDEDQVDVVMATLQTLDNVPQVPVIHAPEVFDGRH